MTRGLPARPLGRCGLAVSRKDPRTVFAVVQTDRTAATLAGQAPRTNGDASTGGVFRSQDRGRTWKKLNSLCPRPFYYGQIRVDPGDDRRVFVLGVRLFLSRDGGKTFPPVSAARGTHGDYHALWINPRDPDHLVLGCDGGLNLSFDRGAHWEHVKNLPLAQCYAAGVDLRQPYRVYAGLQDNGVWGGPSATRSPEGITNAHWTKVLAGDGFACQVDPNNPDVVYAESQYGRLHRLTVRTGTDTRITPLPPDRAPAYRFIWNAPLLVSAHSPRALYFAGNHVFRSATRGSDWKVISPDLTRGQPGRSRHTGHTVTALAESPLKPGLLYAGTDDGRLHLTTNGGGQWTELTARVPGVPRERWVTRVECSRFAAGTTYLTLDRHRLDDRAPYIFKTTDYGAHWQSLAANLPREGPVHVFREDPRNRHLLYLGTEFAMFFSLDGGKNWRRLAGGFPTVAVHDLVVHPRDRELVIATHGRGVYVLDVAPLQELTPEVLARRAHLFEVKPTTAFRPRGDQNWRGAKVLAGENPPYGAVIHYYLKDRPARPVRLTITDAAGKLVRRLDGAREPGFHRLTWGLDRPAWLGLIARPQPVAPGKYFVTLRVGDRVQKRLIRVRAEE
jgi:hypothetical protein